MFLMSKGIGKLQQWILARALRNREHDSGHPNIYYAEVAPGYNLPIWQAKCRQAVADGNATFYQAKAAIDELIDGDTAAERVRQFHADPNNQRFYVRKPRMISLFRDAPHWLVSIDQPNISHAIRSLIDRSLLVCTERVILSYNLTASGVALAEKLAAKPRETIYEGPIPTNAKIVESAA
jgi:hypothetical protein